jgi:hypothetical protein
MGDDAIAVLEEKHKIDKEGVNLLQACCLYRLATSLF